MSYSHYLSVLNRFSVVGLTTDIHVDFLMRINKIFIYYALFISIHYTCAFNESVT